MFFLKRKLFVWLCVLGIAINAIGLFTGIMLGDGVLYALIAKNMIVNNEYFFLTVNGLDWLDKPHFPFWCAAFSYHIFGINDFAYKLPAFLFWLVGILYTYALSKRLYDKNVGQIAVLIYISTLHLLISNSDVRAEPYLTGMIVAAIYHCYRVYNGGTFKHLVFAAFWAAVAVMTKGIFVLIIIASGFLVLWIIRKEWKQFLNYKWYLIVLLTLIFILPELYSLYVQFDARPDALVFGSTNVSGIKFFFWDSQFGRFVNSGPIKGAGDPFFYVHTLLWAFLPWSFIFPFLVYFSFKRKLSIGHPLLWGTFLLTFLMFSASKFQLPHYLNVVFPILSIWLAHLLANVDKLSVIGVVDKIQRCLGILLLVVLVLLTYLYHGTFWWLICLVVLLIGGFFVILYDYKSRMKRIVLSTFVLGLTIGLFYGAYLYPNLLVYQSGDHIAHYINEHKLAPVYVMDNEINTLAVGFQCDGPLDYLRSDEDLKKLDAGDFLVLHNEKLQELSPIYDFSILTSFLDYHVSKIKPRFFYYESREETLGKLYLVQLKDKKESDL
ncbi:ArnT family glycosyltransferase [Olivibacter sitiensis]|uniref:ArnT family glycosyltransferase n=1 Tax=Olivibacter sitiensis TaxID=376470 RepID=UPI0004189823|nr:glycosyltransferase family 39 protein [Olivibacter sitiensis]